MYALHALLLTYVYTVEPGSEGHSVEVLNVHFPTFQTLNKRQPQKLYTLELSNLEPEIEIFSLSHPH